MRRVVVCGGSGLLGRMIATVLESKQIPHVCTYHSRPVPNGVSVDLADEAAVRSLLDGSTHCINCVVERQVSVCDTDWKRAEHCNITIPTVLAKVCAALGVKMIQVSTDYVFDGRYPPFGPDSTVNPLQTYGITKLIAELRVAANCPGAAIVRVPVLYSDAQHSLGESSVTSVVKMVLDRTRTATVDGVCVRHPVHVRDFAAYLVNQVVAFTPGIHHVSNPHDGVTKHQMTEIAAEALRIPNLVTPATSHSGPERPNDTALVDSTIDIEAVVTIRIADGIQQCMSPWIHPRLVSGKVFLLLDLDGTLVDSDRLHYDAYVAANPEIGQQMSFAQFVHLAASNQIKPELERICGDGYAETARRKIEKMSESDTPVTLMPGAQRLLESLEAIPHAVVTNTTTEAARVLREKQPLLNRVVNWICREDYVNPKPSPDGYRQAVARHCPDGATVVGVENTLAGYNALLGVTQCIYLMTSDATHAAHRKCDAYLINDLEVLLR